MNWLSKWLRRVRFLSARAAADQAMDEEMRYHIECEAREYMSRGMDPEGAQRAALIAFGGVERFKEDARDARGIRLAEDLALDARYALRSLRRNVGFAMGALLTLALGIGAVTAIFSVVRGVILRPLPYIEPERLAVLWERNIARGKDENVVAVSNFEAWGERSRSFEAMAALVPAPLTLTGAGEPQRVAGAQVSPSYFRILGARPMIGRAFAEGEHGGAAVVVLAHDFWLRHFHGDRSVVGRAILLDGEPHTILGVMLPTFEPPRFGWLNAQDLWLPFAPTESNRSWGRFLLVLGQLRRGTSLNQAHHEMEDIGRRLALEKKSNAGWSVRVVGLTEQITGDVRTALYVLLVAAGLLLTMAVVNVANLTLAQIRRREHEIAVRIALGASRGRLVRQLLTQSTLLGFAGGAAGLLSAIWGVHLLIALLPTEAPRKDSIHIDATVLAVTALVAVVAVIAFGVWPALQGTRQRIAARLGETGYSGTSDRLGGGALIVAEVALAVGLSITAGLALRSFLTLRAVELGFDASNVAAMRIALPGARYPEPAQRLAFFESLLEATRAVAGVRSAGAISIRPLGGDGPATTVMVEGQPVDAGATAPVADIRIADHDYFRTLRIPLLAGRTFSSQDRADAPPSAIVNHAMAQQLWPERDPIGQRVIVKFNPVITAEVVGVVGDVRILAARTPARPTAYLAFAQSRGSNMDLIIRSDVDVATLVPAVRKRLGEIDPTIPVYEVATMQTLVSDSAANERFTSLLLTAFALSSILLAAIGIYGVLAGDVVRRRQEIGIRLALGARPGAVLALVLRRGLIRAAAGVAIGLVASLVLTRSMRALLFEVSPADPVSFGGVAVLLLWIALLATLVPALRASRVAPTTAMRGE